MSENNKNNENIAPVGETAPEDSPVQDVAQEAPAVEASPAEETPAAQEKITDKTYGDFESTVDYTTVLDDFEGPLDLLLHLINIAKINIEDVFVSKVTEQFLDYIEYMKTQPSRNVDKESEYLQIAAQIIYIKSKSMLPPVEMPDEEFDDAYAEQQAFIEQLKQRELELIQGETPKLKELETVGYYYKEMDREFSKVKIVYKDFTVGAMLEAFAKLLLKNESLAREKTNIREIPKDSYTVEEKVAFIKESLIQNGEMRFEELFTSYSKNEIITTFQAMLEMLKHQYIMVEQEHTFDQILIRLNPEWDLKDDSSETFDEYN